MKKIIQKILLLFFIFLLTASFSLAQTTGISSAQSSFKKFMGGKVASSGNSYQVTLLQSAGFVCIIPGTTLDITPVGSSAPTGPYLIPYGIIGKGGGSPVIGRWILGIYSSVVTPITCTHPTGAVTTVNTYPIMLYGTSKI